MRARPRPLLFAAALALVTALLLPAPQTDAPTPPEPVPSASSDLRALEDRLAELGEMASRQRAAEALRLWPAEGPHTGWWGEYRGGRLHGGIDIDGDSGDPISAAARGTVSHAGAAMPGYSGYGLTVIIEHGEFATLYAHLDRVDVAVGQVVEAGQTIGLMGTTGAVTGSHLHFEVRVAGVPVDPAAFMPPRR